MMYHMKSIITHEEIILPKCMYNVKKIFDFDDTNADIATDLKIREQVINFLKISDEDMAELENRQDILLQKLDVLYDRIVKISSICKLEPSQKTLTQDVKAKLSAQVEIVLNCNPDRLPLYLQLLSKKEGSQFNLAWHIHSSVPNEKIPKIKTFVKNFGINSCGNVDVRLIFSSVSADTELKLSSLAIPIVGDVNVLRYLSIIYPNIYPTVDEFTLDSLLDTCYLLQKASEKSKEGIAKKLFSQCGEWIYNKQFTIVDVAAYNVIKQWRNCPKCVPSGWFKNCEQMFK